MAGPEEAAPPEPSTRPPWGAVGRDLTLAAVAAASKALLTGLNRLQAPNKDALLRAVLERSPGTGLLTVSNHTTTIDDPALFSALLPWRYFLTESQHGGVRWALCAKEICYRNAFLGNFFLSGKTLPVERGAGLDQPVMEVAARLLAGGAWVHVFPEGRVGYAGRLGPCRWGVGKLVCDAHNTAGRDPMVLPFYHSGMGRILPRKARVPRCGQAINVIVGSPLDLEDLTCHCDGPQDTLPKVWQDITRRVEDALLELERNAPRNWDQTGQSGSVGLKEIDPSLPQEDLQT